MATETLSPDGLQATSGLSGTLANVQADDSSWLVATANNINTSARVSFPTPALPPLAGPSLQTIRVVSRKNTTNSGNPTAIITVGLTGGTSVASSQAFNVSAAPSSQQVNDFTFDWSVLKAAGALDDGSDVEAWINTTAIGGSPSTRNSADIDYIGWIATTQAVVVSLTGSLNRTLSAATSQGSASLQQQGVLQRTLAPALSTAVGKLATSGQLSRSLSSATVQSVASSSWSAIAGGVNSTLLVATSAGRGLVTLSGQSNTSLSPAFAASSGVVEITAGMSRTLQQATSASAGVLFAAGVASSTLQEATVHAIGALGANAVTGQLSRILAVAYASAAGLLSTEATLGATLQAAAAANSEGSLALRGQAINELLPAISSSQGGLPIRASSLIGLFPAFSIAAAPLPISGTTAKLLQPANVHSLGISGSGANLNTTLAVATSTAAALLELRANVAQTLAPAVAASSAFLSITGGVGSTLAAAGMASTGELTSVLAGQLVSTLAAATAAASGVNAVRGTILLATSGADLQASAVLENLGWTGETLQPAWTVSFGSEKVQYRKPSKEYILSVRDMHRFLDIISVSALIRAERSSFLTAGNRVDHRFLGAGE